MTSRYDRTVAHMNSVDSGHCMRLSRATFLCV